MNAPLYGVVGTDNLLRIIDNLSVVGNNDQRLQQRGRVCGTIAKADIIDYLWWMDIDPPNPAIAELSNPVLVSNELARTFSPEEALNFTDEERNYAYSWARLPRQELCTALYNALEALNLIA